MLTLALPDFGLGLRPCLALAVFQACYKQRKRGYWHHSDNQIIFLMPPRNFGDIAKFPCLSNLHLIPLKPSPRRSKIRSDSNKIFFQNGTILLLICKVDGSTRISYFTSVISQRIQLPSITIRATYIQHRKHLSPSIGHPSPKHPTFQLSDF